jgi:Xaa-Pro aminopeptidase
MTLSTPQEKLSALRSELKSLGVDGVIVPHADEYQSEYLAPSNERLAWLTGFTGSSGAAVILPDIAAAFTDGRYLLQIADQVDGTLYEIVDMMKANVSDWLAIRGTKGQTIGYDPKLHTVSQIKVLESKLEAAGLKLLPLSLNPLDQLWTDRVEDQILPAEVFPESIAGQSSAEKRATLAAGLKEKGIASVVLTLPDSIAWLLNIRGQDIPHNPLVLSYAILHDDGRVDWFVDERKLTSELKVHLGDAIAIYPHAGIATALKAQKGPVQVDFERSSRWFVNQLTEAGIEVRDGADPAIAPKAIKTPQEQAAMQAAHVRDGVAVTKFLYWFDQEAPKGQLTELDVEAKLLEFRQAQTGLRDTSFDTIAGWGPHGAIVHYRATKESNLKISGSGMLLLDSGAQYSDGTTDITRTICVGTPTPEMKDRFTRVMRGHIAVAMAKFPENTPGAQIDTLARLPLWDEGLDYSHGTGHGVGCYLCVHEESARISPRGHGPIKASMIISNEPGYYKDGEYGIRCENLNLSYETGEVFNDGRKMLAFKTITLAPFDKRLIDNAMLTHEERAWLMAYHQRVYDTLSPFLTPQEAKWLEKQI